MRRRRRGRNWRGGQGEGVEDEEKMGEEQGERRGKGRRDETRKGERFMEGRGLPEGKGWGTERARSQAETSFLPSVPIL